jgi:hypothetical protein
MGLKTQGICRDANPGVEGRKMSEDLTKWRALAAKELKGADPET